MLTASKYCISHIRPDLEYCVQAWCLWLEKEKQALEKVQRRATELKPTFKKLPYEEWLQALNIHLKREEKEDGTLFNIAQTSIKLPWCIVSPTSWSPFLTVSSFQPAGQQEATARNSMFRLPVPPWWRAHSSLTPSVCGMYCLSKSWTLQHWMSSRLGSATSASPSLMSSCNQFLILYIFFLPACVYVCTSLNAPQHLCEYTPRSFCTVSEEES